MTDLINSLRCFLQFVGAVTVLVVTVMAVVSYIMQHRKQHTHELPIHDIIHRI